MQKTVLLGMARILRKVVEICVLLGVCCLLTPVLFEEASYIASNQQIYDFSKQIILEKTLWKVIF